MTGDNNNTYTPFHTRKCRISFKKSKSLIITQFRCIPLILINDDICELCFGCAAICPVGAIEVDVHQAKIDQDLCTDCKLCIKACPLGAISE